MKSFRKAVIATMLAVGPVLAAGAAWANTELVPGSRLVAPYWDISGDRSTLMLIANVSRRANLVKNTSSADLKGVCNLGTALPGSPCAVHLEFYDKTCDNVNLTIDLSKQDIDQLDILTDSDLGGVRGLASKLGWMDADVRRNISGSGHTNTGVQANVLVGTVIITDSGSDFVVAYPMASGTGSSDSGVGGDIVTRDGQGDANVWTGAYESFPARVYVPMFFAEGSNNGVTFTSTLAIAGPAQSFRNGEAPGQDLEDDPVTGDFDEGILIDAEVDVVDACENAQSDDIRDHYIFGTLDELFTNQVTAPYGSVCAVYPAGDVDRKASGFFQGGFLDIVNNAIAHSWVGGVDIGGPLEIERGLVGVLVQNTASKGDVTRLWGECSYGTDGEGGIAESGCRNSYSLVNDVDHDDILP